jgi:hypothetical protein
MLADMGTDPKTIWQQTGTWKGPDGKWRQEIDDSGAKVKNLSEMQFGNKETLQQGQSAVGPVKDFMLHKNLSRAYDGLMDFGKGNQRLTMRVNPDNAGGFFNENLGHIEVGMKDQSINKSTAIHELQHAIQGREGFARGGSPEAMAMEGSVEINPDFVSGLQQWNKTLQKYGYPKEKMFTVDDIKMNDPEYLWNWIQGQGGWLEDKLGKYSPEFDKAFPTGVSVMKVDANEAYRRLAGEAEARATQARMNMTPEQRRAMFPEESYDVPMNELIIRTD